MDMFICIFYFLGMIATFYFLNKELKEYNDNHQNEVKNQTREDRKYIENMMIVTSIFSWFAFIALILGKFCNTNDEE